MNAHAHLLSLGWAGPGHSLDSRPYKQKGHRGLAYDLKSAESRSTNSGVGLVKPLLVSRRKDRFGIGKKAHEPSAGNEWWLKGFETALGNIGKSESERSSGIVTPVKSESAYAGKHEGLYEFFVKGQGMSGTIGEEDNRRSKKRKSGAMNDDEGLASSSDTSADFGRRTEQKKKDAAAEFEQVSAFIAARDNDRKVKRRDKKANSLQQFEQFGEFFDARSGGKSRKKKSDLQVTVPEHDTLKAVLGETKEERRARRRRRKEEKETRKTSQQVDIPNKENGVNPTSNGAVASDKESDRQARKAERKRLKAGRAI